MLSAIASYSSTSVTHLGLWAHLQQPLATTAGRNNSKRTEPNIRTVRAQRRNKNLQQRKKVNLKKYNHKYKRRPGAAPPGPSIELWQFWTVFLFPGWHSSWQWCPSCNSTKQRSRTSKTSLRARSIEKISELNSLKSHHLMFSYLINRNFKFY